MPDSLEKLDLLLLTVPKTMRVRPDGIHLGMRYIYPTLASCLCRRRVLEADRQATLRYPRLIEHIPTCNSPKRV
jgi:hypothetical protein